MLLLLLQLLLMLLHPLWKIKKSRTQIKSNTSYIWTSFAAGVFTFSKCWPCFYLYSLIIYWFVWSDQYRHSCYYNYNNTIIYLSINDSDLIVSFGSRIVINTVIWFCILRFCWLIWLFYNLPHCSVLPEQLELDFFFLISSVLISDENLFLNAGNGSS